MKSTCKPIITAFALLVLAASGAYAQSPREQLQHLTAQLQKSLTDSALRERIVKLAAEIKPAPAIPEEANRFFVRGNVFQKEAKDASGYELAISAYREALRIAPWWGDAYFNLAAAQGSAGKFDEAIASQKLFIAAVPAGSAEAREAQNKIYALEARKEMTASESANKARQASTKAQEQRISGTWKRPHTYGNGVPRLEVLHIRQAPDGRWNILQDYYNNNELRWKGDPFQAPDTAYAVVNGELRFKSVRRVGNVVCASYDVKGTVAADGNTLNLAYTLMPSALDRSDEKCPSRGGYKDSVDTFTR